MRFCKVCERTMSRDALSGAVIFRCACGAEEAGEPKDACISSGTTEASETTAALYRHLIQTAPSDRTNQLIARDCPNCGLDYLTHIRVGSAETIIYRCSCGYEESGGRL